LRQRLESAGVTVSRFDVSTDSSDRSSGRDDGRTRQSYEPESRPPQPGPSAASLVSRFQRPTATRIGGIDVTA
jgi:hypothetical protein